MPMHAADIESLLKETFTDAEITIIDLAGDGDHYKAIIKSNAFAGMPRVRQHQAVYAALKGRMGGELHALALETGLLEPPTS
jgi:stress-induced morphogen